MQTAPEVKLALRPSVGWRRLSVLLVLAAVATGWVWAASSAWSGWGVALALLTLGHAVWLLKALDTAPAAQCLHWTRQVWHFDEGLAGRAAWRGEVDVLVDLGSGLLLRFRPAARRGRPRILALARADHPGQWHALRCALYSPRPSDSAPARTPTA